MTKQTALCRHHFLIQGTAFSLPLLVPSAVLAKPPRRKGAGDTVRLGFVGTERRGQQLLETLPEVGRASNCRRSDLGGSRPGSSVRNRTYLMPSFQGWLDRRFQDTPEADRLATVIAQSGAAGGVFLDRPYRAVGLSPKVRLVGSYLVALCERMPETIDTSCPSPPSPTGSGTASRMPPKPTVWRP